MAAVLFSYFSLFLGFFFQKHSCLCPCVLFLSAWYYVLALPDIICFIFIMGSPSLYNCCHSINVFVLGGGGVCMFGGWGWMCVSVWGGCWGWI